MNETREWKDALHDCYYFFNKADGRIVGQVNKIAHTSVWLAKIINNHNDESFLGQYISCMHAQDAVVLYWIMQERTLLESNL